MENALSSGMSPEGGRPPVCAVVVTYHPDEGLPGRLARIGSQAGAVVVVDNGSTEAAGMLRGLAANPAIEVICNLENLGIARALNIGIDHAIRRGYSWAVLFDQDTEADHDLVVSLQAALASHPDATRVAVAGARFRDTQGRPDEARSLGSRGDQWEEVESVVTSGSLLSLGIFKNIGRFRDEFFIDYVDTEYCFRARAAGYKIIETRRPLMSHTVGAPTPHRMLWKSTWTTNHSAERRYYIARNNTVMLREYGTSKGRSWRIKSIARCLRLCKRIAYFERDKAAKIFAVCQGWRDAVRGNMGPRPRSRPEAPP